MFTRISSMMAPMYGSLSSHALTANSWRAKRGIASHMSGACSPATRSSTRSIDFRSGSRINSIRRAFSSLEKTSATVTSLVVMMVTAFWAIFTPFAGMMPCHPRLNPVARNAPSNQPMYSSGRKVI